VDVREEAHSRMKDLDRPLVLPDQAGLKVGVGEGWRDVIRSLPLGVGLTRSRISGHGFSQSIGLGFGCAKHGPRERGIHNELVCHSTKVSPLRVVWEENGSETEALVR
jgi:hypothetical protein